MACQFSLAIIFEITNMTNVSNKKLFFCHIRDTCTTTSILKIKKKKPQIKYEKPFLVHEFKHMFFIFK